MDFIEWVWTVVSGVSPVVTAVATSTAALVAWAGYRHIIAHEKPVLDFSITKFYDADNVLEARLTVRNAARTTIVVKNVRLLKPKFPRSGNPQIGLASETALDQPVQPLAELREPFEVEPKQKGGMNFLLYLYQRYGELVTIKLGVDIEYIGTTIKTHRMTIKREIQMPPPRSTEG